MPRNLHGGNKAKRGANKNANAQTRKSKDDIPLPDETEKQYVGQIVATLGDCRYTALLINKECSPTKNLMIHLPGSLRKRSRVIIGSVVLLSHRDFENKGDICYVYMSDEKEYLISKGFIFENSGYNTTKEDDLDGIVFASAGTTEVDESNFDVVIDGL
jgi:initiation factor 1A